MLALAGCAGEAAVRAPSAPPAALHASGLRAVADPTVRGARLVPLDVQGAHAWGVEPGGGTRAIAAGVRVVEWPDGSMGSADGRLPPAVSGVTAVPERMGGGFLYTVGGALWRSDSWLGRARPVFAARTSLVSVQVGLDRVYVRTHGGGFGALDPRTGEPVDLGPVPRAPSLGPMAALDAWRAVVVADLRGPALTLDAGSTWRPLHLPVDPTEVVALDDAIALGGLDALRQMQWWEVRPSGQVGRLASAPALRTEASRTSALRGGLSGERPLAAAIEDGWPLSDGTALVARDGTLARVRLSDGGIAESVADAYPLKPSRCHAVTLARAADPGAVGFVCGESRGRTVVYRLDAGAGSLQELRRFDEPRAVLASANGALAVRGPCDAGGAAGARDAGVAWCVMPPGGAWREIRLRGDDAERARVVVLPDGRLALVRPPRAGDLSTARLTLTDGSHTTTVPLGWPELHADVAQALRLGVWMDGFEERRPGILGGWIDVAGSLVGVEIDLDGRVRVGEYVKDAGWPFASGRWALGWTASRRGFESTDGGMTWTKDIDLPDPIATPRDVGERACGPVGCLVGGWMRVGWGSEGARSSSSEALPAARFAPRAPSTLDLICEPLAGRPPALQPRAAGVPAAPPLLSSGIALPRAWLAGVPSSPVCTSAPAPFQGQPGPPLGHHECALQAAASSVTGNVHVYAWGPRSGDWDAGSRWKVSWLWPWGGWAGARSSATVAAPWATRDAAARFLGLSAGLLAPPALLAGDDPDHALLVVRRGPTLRSGDLLVLESNRAPVEVRRPSGDPFSDVQAGVRVAGTWFVATAGSAGEPPAAVVWDLDGPAARLLARLPRATPDPLSTARLARSSDGDALGIVVDGQPALDGSPGARWVVALDPDTGALSDPEAMAPLSDSLAAPCTGDDAGWQVDLPYPGTVRLQMGARGPLGLQTPYVRVRLGRTRSCVERVTAVAEREPGAADLLGAALTPRLAGRELDTDILASGTRFALRCAVAE